MTNPQTCPVCRVSIVNDVVHFSNGNPGTRARLYARVCQYVNQKGCINQDADKIGELDPKDGFAVPQAVDSQ
ncbi:MAG: hypothetical protein SW833_09115 [Cyanobacteriota bacterium]|nr:hypothetical protein [Cyanobacteriota bacterium]